jgi:peptide chain release factor 3
MEHEFAAPVRLEPLAYGVARATDGAGGEALNRSRLVHGEAMTRVKDGAVLALFPNRWHASSFEREFPGHPLESLIAAHEGGE